MSEYIHKSHNVSVFLYHLVFPAKYRRAVLDEQVDAELREVSMPRNRETIRDQVHRDRRRQRTCPFLSAVSTDI